MRLKYLLGQSDTFTQFLSSGPMGSLISLDNNDTKKNKSIKH